MKNTKGFSLIEGILILVIVGLLGVTGWYIWNTHNKTADTFTNADAANSSVITNKGSLDTNAAQLVLQFYDKYKNLNLLNDQKELVKQYGTDKLSTYFDNNQHGVDPILCAQMSPSAVTIDSHSLSGTTATVVVNEVVGSDSLKITAKAMNQNGLKIDSITCPTSLPTGTP